MRHIHLLALVISLLLVGPAATAAAVQDAAADDLGEFVAFCPFSHRAGDDPIVHPGMSGMSHMHDFLGNTGTDANSTYQTWNACVISSSAGLKAMMNRPHLPTPCIFQCSEDKL